MYTYIQTNTSTKMLARPINLHTANLLCGDLVEVVLLTRVTSKVQMKPDTETYPPLFVNQSTPN